MDVTYKKLNDNIFSRYPNKFFVETGTYLGDSVQLALDAGFEHVVSIELSEKYCALAQTRFWNNPKVRIYNGDSGMVLLDIIKDIQEPITFWLDGHYSKGDTAIGKYCTPLMIELMQISKHPINTHTIMVDDMRCWSKPLVGRPVCKCELYPCENFYGFYSQDVVDALLKINPNYILSYEDHDVPNDILIAHVK
jgi:hypothetical protein